jgi:hypothetical protein
MNAPLNPGAKSAGIVIDGGLVMRTLPALCPTTPQSDDDQIVPEELVGRLYRANGGGVADVVAGLSLSQRANLAMFFYRKSHLHRIGLAIAATCDHPSLVQAWGGVLGQALFDRSREGIVQPAPQPSPRRNTITLAKSAAFDWTIAEPGEAATRH